MSWIITSDQVSPPGDAAITYGITNAGGVFNLRSTGTVDYEAEWGDGNVEISTLNVLPHTYTAGDYSVVVYSDGVYRPYFNNVSADANQITSVAIGSGANLGTSLDSAWETAINLATFTCPFDATSSVTNFVDSWRRCNSLTSFPLIDTSSGTSFSYAWYNCSSLTSFPLLNTSSGTSFFAAWSNCSNLASFPLLIMSSGTDFGRAWNSCSSLTSFPLVNTSSSATFAATWEGCSNLASFPLLNMSSSTSFVYTWNNCTSLTSFPLVNTSSGTNFTATWASCSSLTSFPLLNTSSGADFRSAWAFCSSLSDFPANMFDTTGALIAAAFNNAWRNCALTAQSIENILVSLDTNGATGITLGIDGGTNADTSTWSAAANAAWLSLDAKGWNINQNGPDPT
jgi:hypothetical protein